MNYEEMSNLEINKAVAKAQGDYWFVKGYKVDIVGDTECFVDIDGSLVGMYRDYCDNPSDAWPIIVENQICIDFRITASKLDPIAYWGDDLIYSVNENPLRAAMIVYLMMQEAKQDA